MGYIGKGKKTLEWEKMRPILIRQYALNGITSCEYCGSTYILDIHHLDKRSSGRAKHTFDDTRLLCREHHTMADDARYTWLHKLLKNIR